MCLRKKMLRGSIDGGESCCKYAELLPGPILDGRTQERNSYFGECYVPVFCVFGEGVYAYLRRTPRTLPWMLTLAAGA